MIFWVWIAFTNICLLASLTELFKPNASSLFKLCLEASSRNLSEVNYTNEYIKSEYFLGFLRNLNTSLARKSIKYSWTDWRNWESHYYERENFANHPVCTAAAFSYLPFSLRKVKGMNHNKRTFARVQDKASLSLKLVTAESLYQSSFVYLKRTACIQNISVEVVKYSGRFEKSTKTILFADRLKKIYDSTPPISRKYMIVLFVDSYDVIIQLNATAIIQRFLDFNHSIVFGVEHTCFPLKYFPWNLNLGKWLGTMKNGFFNNRYICDHLFPALPEDIEDRENRCKFYAVCFMIAYSYSLG